MIVGTAVGVVVGTAVRVGWAVAGVIIVGVRSTLATERAAGMDVGRLAVGEMVAGVEQATSMITSNVRVEYRSICPHQSI